MKTKHVLLALVTICLFSGCADANPHTIHEAAGFWSGLWHGMISVFSFIGIMFGADIGIYEVANNGNWYNFGFLWGAGALTFTASKTTN
jgi:hypothetical protein